MGFIGAIHGMDLNFVILQKNKYHIVDQKATACKMSLSHVLLIWNLLWFKYDGNGEDKVRIIYLMKQLTLHNYIFHVYSKRTSNLNAFYDTIASVYLFIGRYCIANTRYLNISSLLAPHKSVCCECSDF